MVTVFKFSQSLQNIDEPKHPKKIKISYEHKTSQAIIIHLPKESLLFIWQRETFDYSVFLLIDLVTLPHSIPEHQPHRKG